MTDTIHTHTRGRCMPVIIPSAASATDPGFLLFLLWKVEHWRMAHQARDAAPHHTQRCHTNLHIYTHAAVIAAAHFGQDLSLTFLPQRGNCVCCAERGSRRLLLPSSSLMAERTLARYPRPQAARGEKKRHCAKDIREHHHHTYIHSIH
jgi:hypothetical protein